ncbi:hypothetical protein D9M69_731420 [compost metagenome]
MAGQGVHVLAGEGVHKAGAHVGQQGEVKVQGLGLVLVQFFGEALVLAGGGSENFGERPGAGHDHTGHLREEDEPGRFLGEKAQLHIAFRAGDGWAWAA